MTEKHLLVQFYGAVKTRIEDRQNALWSRIIGAGFTDDDIENIWPEANMRFFHMRYSGHTQSFQLRDLNLRELDAVASWILKQQDLIQPPKSEAEKVSEIIQEFKGQSA